MGFIRLTNRFGKAVYINAAYIASLHETLDGETAVFMAGDAENWHQVKESPETVVTIIRKGEGK